MRVVVLSHFLFDPFDNDSAASSAVARYLKDHNWKVIQIEHPFIESADKNSVCVDLDTKKKLHIGSLKLPFGGTYVLDVFTDIYFLLRTWPSYDLAVACDSLTFLSVLFFRKIGLVKKSVYYSIDFVEQRFQNKVLNSIFHFIDRLALTNSEVNWVVSKEMVTARKKYGVNIDKCAPFKVVPIGYRLSEIKVRDASKVKLENLVVCGTLRESAGTDIIIKAIPIIRKESKVNVTFAGGGDTKPYKELAKSLGVLPFVKFMGRIKTHKEMVEIMTSGSVGLAPYQPTPGSISFNSDPGKIKLYLCCGLPVITTSIATSSKVITKTSAGVVTGFSEAEFARGVLKIIGDKRTYAKYKGNAVKLSHEYDVDRIFEKVLSNV